MTFRLNVLKSLTAATLATTILGCGGSVYANAKSTHTAIHKKATTTHPTLRIGSRGSNVKYVQKAVGARPFDGIFGPLTRTKVKAYQHAHHLYASGVVDAKTWSIILKPKSPAKPAAAQKVVKQPSPKSPPKSPPSTSTAKPAPGPTIASLWSIPDGECMQGVTVHDGDIFTGFDLRNGNGEIKEYSPSGQLQKKSGPLPIGHSASLSYDDEDGYIYAANGGGQTPTKVYVVDMDSQTPTVVKTLDFSQLGDSGLAAVDNSSNTLWIHTAPNDRGPITFTKCTMDGSVLAHFTLPNQGVPQGLDIYQGNLYYYTDNKISVIDPSGKLLKSITVSEKGESEGLAVVGGNKPYIIFGYSGPNRYYTLTGFLQ
jgi:peptidoglycan hydrolase-like protein with peptidoglycan-binding domain